MLGANRDGKACGGVKLWRTLPSGLALVQQILMFEGQRHEIEIRYICVYTVQTACAMYARSVATGITATVTISATVAVTVIAT